MEAITKVRSAATDSTTDIDAARLLYADFGFAQIASYYHNPITGAHYLKADL